MPTFLSLQQINPCIRSAGKEEFSRTIGAKRIIHDYEFIYCHQGAFSVIYENNTVSINSGEIQIITPGIWHQLDERNAKEVYWVHFDFFYHDNQEDLARYIISDKTKAFSDYTESKPYLRTDIRIKPNYSLPTTYQVTDINLTKQCFTSMVHLYEEKGFGWQFTAKNALTTLLSDTIRNLVLSDNYKSTDLELVGMIDDYILENIRDHIRISDIAGHFHYHKDTLGRLYKKITGSTISETIKKIRISSVKQLLVDSDLSIDYIAEQFGFTDRSHLIKTFTAVASMTPTEYRRKHKASDSK